MSLRGTEVLIVYCGGGFPYHIHWKGNCHACCEQLAVAKEAAKIIVQELLSMGMEP